MLIGLINADYFYKYIKIFQFIGINQPNPYHQRYFDLRHGRIRFARIAFTIFIVKQKYNDASRLWTSTDYNKKYFRCCYFLFRKYRRDHIRISKSKKTKFTSGAYNQRWKVAKTSRKK